jgi:CubicO group peptidase (beta-lactamase class C family)
MIRRVFAFGLCALLGVAVASNPVLAQDDPRLAAIAPQVEALLARHGLPGAVLLVNQHGRPVYARAFGSYTLATRLPIASASKWLSASVIARLVDQGRLDWDDRLDRYIDGLPPDKAAITLRQLFSLTSGLPGGGGSDGHPCLGERDTTLERCAREILALPLTAPPGSVFDYGGNAMQVAGWMAERATGRDWNQLFRSELAQPLGWSATDYGPLRGVDVGNPRIAGGIYSTAGEYLQLVQLHLDDGATASARLLEPHTTAQMQQVQTAQARIGYTPYPGAVGYGLGLWIDRLDARGHSRQVSSIGAFAFTPWLDRELGIAAVLAVFGSNQEQGADIAALQAQIAAALAPSTAGAVPFADVSGIWWNPAEAGAGYFLSQRVDHGLTVAWYTYDESGAQQWLLGANGQWQSSDRWSGTLYRTRHAATGAISRGVQPAAVITQTVGTLSLQFSDGGHATLDFSLDGVSGRRLLERFEF